MKQAPLSLASLSRALAEGTLILSDHINSICDRLEEEDGELHSFLPEEGRRARLLEQAAGLEQAFPRDAPRPPLYGVLVGVKDVLHVDGFITRANSRLDPILLAGREAESVRLLRNSGALILGKTVTTEFAYFAPGPTRNPHNLAHTPGGSSSGSAAAVAAGFAPLALGTQTVGSIIRPAAYCGVVGFKASHNRIPTAGLLYYSRTFDHVGCLTADVESMSLAASVLCEDWRDVKVDFQPVLGVPRGPYLEQASPEALQAFASQLDLLRQAGYVVKEVNAFADIAEINTAHRLVAAAEMAREHAELFSRYAKLYRKQTAAQIREGQRVNDNQLAEARNRVLSLRERLEEEMRGAGVDLWVSPAAPGPAPAGLSSTGDPVMNVPWTGSGLPVLTIPAGLAANNLPLGLQVAAPFLGDELLLAWSEELATALHP